MHKDFSVRRHGVSANEITCFLNLGRSMLGLMGKWNRWNMESLGETKTLSHQPAGAWMPSAGALGYFPMF